jgi:7-keto-8-aminopelargonate synthetase-like enzyme/acyl-CoA synthetase (AMP-forming)/AMP-acid ligase II/acyl carrier protein
MHSLLKRWRVDDMASLFATRLDASDRDALIGFYDRRSKRMQTENQTAFLARAFNFATRLREHSEPGAPVIVACAAPASALTAYVGAVVCGAVPIIYATRPAFDDVESFRAGIDGLAQLLGGSPLVVTSADRRMANRLSPGVRFLELDIDALDAVPATGLTVLHVPSDPHAALHLQSTSGTTGRGRLAVVTHANLIDNVSALLERLEYERHDRLVSWLPLYHDMGLVSCALLSLASGTDAFLMSPFEFLADPAAWLRSIAAERGTWTATPNFGLEHTVRRVESASIEGIDLSSWSRCGVGAEPIDARVVKRFVERFGPYGFASAALKPSYGLAEATLLVTMPNHARRPRVLVVDNVGLTQVGNITVHASLDIDDFNNGLTAGQAAVVALGTPAPGMEVVIVDDEQRPITDELRCGEIVVRGASVSPGYRLPDGSLDATGDHLVTGDVGFVYDSDLYVVERLKNIIIRNGENYSATVLESELAAVLDRRIDDVMVFDSDLRPGAGLVTAVIGVDRDEPFEDLVRALRADPDRFELPIERLVLVPRGAISRTTSGKKQHAVMRAALQSNDLNVLAEHQLLARRELTVESDLVIDIDEIDAHSRALTIIEQLARQRGVTAPVVESSNLAHDLGFDSLALFEMAVTIETTLHLDIPEESLASMKHVSDVLDVVSRQRTAATSLGLSKTIDASRDAIPQTLCVVTEQKGRQVKISGRWVSDFASCNYLGFDVHPEVQASIAPALTEWGVHPSWTRAVASPVIYRELERALADLVGAHDVVAFPTITLIHIGVLPRLAGPHGVILIDQAAHHSIHEAAELASARGTTVVPFPHDDLDALADALARAARAPRRIIAVDGVYSISGRAAPLPALLRLAERYDATVYVDDAHGFGVIGERPSASRPWGARGNGVVRHFGLDYDRIVYVGGLSKAYSSLAAFVTANSPAERRVLEMASTAVFSGPIPVASLASGLAGIAVNDREGEHLREHLHRLTVRLLAGARQLGYHVDNPLAFPIVTVELGSLASVVRGCQILWDEGILLTPAVFPAAPIDHGGVRFTLTAANTASEVEGLINGLAAVREADDIAVNVLNGASPGLIGAR